MKKITLFVVCCFATTFLFAQNVVDTVYTTFLTKSTPSIDFKTKALTFGVLQGGGSLIGADLEILMTERIGIQAGMGMFGYGFGLNYHLKPGINTSFLSLAYWHQGVGDAFMQSRIGPTFVYRAKRIFTAQIGFGALLGTGPNTPDAIKETPICLLYSIGLYFPI